MTIWGDRESWEEKARRKRKRKRESEKRRGRLGEGNHPVSLPNYSVTLNPTIWSQTEESD
jgi:hypothetical protein